MPELPEVEIVRRGLNKFTSGHKIIGGEVLLSRTLAYPYAVLDFYQAITDLKVSSWQRRGKYLLAQLSNKSILGVHLRMTGQLLWLTPETPLQKHTRVRLFFESNQELRFVDTRTFGKFWLVPPNTAPEKIITGLKNIGLEPFDSDFSAQYLQAKLSRCRRPIKTALLDQSIIAGIGNIYADESLFQSKIKPDTISCELDLNSLENLKNAIVEVLETAIAAGGTTFSDFLQVTGTNGNYGGMAWVYGRKNQPCKICQTPIERIKLSGRSTHFCPQCQE